MEGRCFDRWTKALSEAPSRRRVIQGLAGGVLAGIFTAGTASAACGRLDDDCNDDRDCCRRYTCDNKKCKRRACGRLDAECRKDKDCCRRYVCDNRKCKRA